VFAIVAGVTVAGAAVARDVAHGTASWQESVPARLDGFGRGVLGSARAVATGLLGTSVRRLSRDGAEQVPGSPVLERRVPERWRFACSAGAFALTLCLWLVVGSGIGQPLHALAVVAFLAAPALLAGRFVRASGPVETGFFSLGIAAATWGIAAAATFISQDWTPESAVVICVSALVGCVSAVDLSQSLRRRRRAVVA
jgi:drug/metabolite transporter (DMT)-like permease